MPTLAPTTAAPQNGPGMVMVSNRLPVMLQRGPQGLEWSRSPGGLVSAIEAALEERGGSWIGWTGSVRPVAQCPPFPKLAYQLQAVPLHTAEVEEYYHGFCNRTLWPLFHCFAGRTHFARGEWRMYERVNARFAEAAAAVADGAELVWVHDYHLMVAPRYLRRQVGNGRIAFFLHIPFPPYDLFRLLPWDQELLDGLLGADLIGFHTATYADNFLSCVERLLGTRVDREAGSVEYGDRSVRVAAFPLGIDFERFASWAEGAAATSLRQGERVVLGVDRLDYTKGIPERLLAFERLLDLYPEYRDKVVLLQVAVPSRVQVKEYREQKRQIDELVGRVNGRFGSATWSPIRYLYRSLRPEQLAGLYRDAEVALVTPLRDGMNLVAKEFVACQVGAPGVLVLSRFTGAAETMREAIHVNPYNVDATAEALHRALTMPEEERRSRLAALRRREDRHNVTVWRDQFLQAALAGPVVLKPPVARDFERWLGPFLRGYRVALFLDYDGTLAPIRPHPTEAVLTAGMREKLQACLQRGDTDVAIVSGRALPDLTQMVGHTALTYGANHGLEIIGPDLPTFRHEDLGHYEAKIEALADALGRLEANGVWTERKGATLTLHFRGAPQAQQALVAEEGRTIIRSAGFQARDAHCAIEARPPIAWDKGHAVFHILRCRYGLMWAEQVRVIYVGDDETDEDAFRILVGLGMTFRVGRADALSAATRRLANVGAVEALLDWIARRPAANGALVAGKNV